MGHPRSGNLAKDERKLFYKSRKDGSQCVVVTCRCIVLVGISGEKPVCGGDM